MKNLALSNGRQREPLKDRLVVMVRDPFWLHAYWELTHQSVVRAEAALGQNWHTANPVLRLLEVTGVNSSSKRPSERVVRHIPIHGGVNNWYIDVNDPPKTYRVVIGYLAGNGEFFGLAQSNVVSTPRPASADALDENWTDVAQNFEKIYAMSGGKDLGGELQELFEERLRRPMDAPVIGRVASAVNGHAGRMRNMFTFELDAELIVYGSTAPGSRVTIKGEPVQLREDGTFTVRFSMPNCRQVIPAVASTADGIEQRTIVLAVDRNTKTMEPVIRDNTS